MKNLTSYSQSDLDFPDEQYIRLLWNAFYLDPHDPNNETIQRYNNHNYNGALDIPVVTPQRPGLMSTADKAALGAASRDIEDIKQIIEDNELTTAAALNDLNSRVKELEPEEDKIYVALVFGTRQASGTGSSYGASYLFGYIKDNVFHIYSYENGSNIYPITMDFQGYISGSGQMFSGKYLAGPTLNSEPGYLVYSAMPT